MSSADVLADPAVRPGPLRWLAYAYGSGLPERNREWVYRDTTSPSWLWRHLGHWSAQVAPVIAAVVIFLPGPAWIRIVGAVGGIALSLVFSFAYVVETTEHRLVKAGYPSGTGEAARSGRSTSARTEAVRRRNEKAAARRAARRQREYDRKARA